MMYLQTKKISDTVIAIEPGGAHYMRTDIPLRRSEIEVWIEEGKSKAYICREISCKPSTLDFHLKVMGISYAGNKFVGLRPGGNKRPVIERLRQDTVYGSHYLKNLLFRDGLKERCCEECGITVWQDRPAPLELHHINGDRFDNRLENLQILCSNCHSLTSNNSGKGMRTALAQR